MQDPLPNELCSLRLAQGLTVRGCEVRHEDGSPHRIPPREVAYALLGCMGLQLPKRLQTACAHQRQP